MINCDTKGWTNLTGFEFPEQVITLTLVGNKLKFNTRNRSSTRFCQQQQLFSSLVTADDIATITDLPHLEDLNLNGNPLGTIPAFNHSIIRSLSLQDASLTSIEFPSVYKDALQLATLSLSKNKIRSIGDSDLFALRNSKLDKIQIDEASLSHIDQNAFVPLKQLQSLSLKDNQLKSCDFLATLPHLSSINLDGNQFTSLPPQLAAPRTVKTFSFKRNALVAIDASSPLDTWQKKNLTNVKVYLANNSFDCCRSLWLVEFLKTSAHYVGDASLLTCAKPSALIGKFLVHLDPEAMNCGAGVPSRPWWIIGLGVGGAVAIVSSIAVVVKLIRQRQHRSSYTEINGIDDPSPAAPPPNDLVFPVYDHDADAFSEYSTSISGRTTTGSEAPTFRTADGASVLNR